MAQAISNRAERRTNGVTLMKKYLEQVLLLWYYLVLLY